MWWLWKCFCIAKVQNLQSTKNDSWAQNRKSWELARAYYRKAWFLKKFGMKAKGSYFDNWGCIHTFIFYKKVFYKKPRLRLVWHEWIHFSQFFLLNYAILVPFCVIIRCWEGFRLVRIQRLRWFSRLNLKFLK